jgi:hypothetical protein
VGGALGDAVVRRAAAALLAVAFASHACSATVEEPADSGQGGQTGDGGGGGAEMSPDPDPDPCADVDFGSNLFGCCDAGCHPFAHVDGTRMCTSPTRLCSVDAAGDEWERPCDVGYECRVVYGSDEPDPCLIQGEVGVGYGLWGYCIWTGEGES